MDVGTTKAELLDAVRAERAGWDRLLAAVGEERMMRPGVAGEWTFKDVAAHLSGWRERTLLRLDAARGGTAPAPAPWPAELDDDTDDGVDQINDWIYRRNQDRSIEEVLDESRRQLQQLEEVVAALSEEDLFDPHRFPWMEGEPLGPGIVGGSFGHLHEEHEPGIRAWLATLDAST